MTSIVQSPEHGRSAKTDQGTFTGPIFIVGMPRSGTKLLRELLNNHSQIAITPNESHFIPDFYTRRESYGNLQEPRHFSKFYHDFSQTVFFQRVTDGNNFVDEESWYREVTVWTYAGVVETFYRLYARTQNKTIWGDKTPYYLVILPLLKSLFPDARFVHIVRDVRDYSLSLKKGWNKNIYRSAQRWYDAVRKCRQNGISLSAGAYYEVRYEQLVDAPAQTLQGICKFLSVPYEETMTILRRPADLRGGDAQNRLDILRKNYGKWESSLSGRQIRRIESICGELLVELGYATSCDGPSKRVPFLEMEMYKLLDAFSLLRFEIRENGVREGFRNVVRAIPYAQYRSASEEDH